MNKLGKFAAAFVAVLCAFNGFGALPAPYQAVEYIESHGKEGFDAGFSPAKSGGTGVEIEFAMTGGGTARGNIFSCRVCDWNGYMLLSQNGTVAFGQGFTVVPYEVGLRAHFTCSTAGAWTVTTNGFPRTSGTGASLQNKYYDNHLRMFDCGKGSYAVYCRNYGTKFWTNDGPIRMFVPCYSNGVNGVKIGGMYDLVEGKFYTTDNGGAFTWGEDRLLADDLLVRGDPVNCGTPSLAYGVHSGYAVDAPVTISFPRVGMNADETIQGTCTGYEVLTNGLVYASGTFDETTGDTCSFSFNFPDCDHGAEVVLKWTAQCKVSATCDATKGSVSKTFEWHTPGETFTVTATPAPGHSFYRWLGSDGVEYGRDATLELTVADTVVLTAVFTDARQLAPSGEDDSDALIALIDTSQDGDFISLASGTYKISKTIEISKNVQIVGADRDTTIVEGSGSVRIFKINGSTAPDALLANLTIQKGCGCGNAGNNGEGMMVNYGGGAALLDQGGTIRNCIIEKDGNNTSGNVGGHGVQIVGAGKIVDSIIRNITGGNDLAWGQALIAGNGALVDHCVISNIQATALRGSTAPVELYGSGTEMRNCLITGCKYGLKGSAAVGVYFRTAGAKLTSCTIAGNTITTASGYAVRGTGTVKNSIVADNLVNTAVAAAESDVASDVTVSYSFTRPQTTGEGNVTGETVFKADTFELAPGCPAIGGGDVEAWMSGAKDLKGIDRLRDEQVDMGAFTYVPPALACSISCADDKTVLDAIDVTVSSFVEGKTEGVVYSWKVNGTEAGTDATFNLKTSVPGAHSVVLDVENASGDTASSEPIVFTVVPATIYVDSTSTEPVAPYGDPAHAAATLQDAVDASMAGCAILVKPGTYELNKTLYITWRLSIRSLGTRDDTVIHVNGNFPGVSLDAVGTEFAGFTVEHGYMSLGQYNDGGSRGGGNLYAGEGTLVHDCRFSDASCYGHDPVMGGTSLGVYNATVRDCEIVNNTRSSRGSNWQMYNGAVKVSGANAVVERCLFEGNIHVNAHRGSEWRCVAGLYLTDGLVRNCLFRGNGMTDSGTGSSNVRAAAAFVVGGTLENCTFVSNTITRAGSDTPPAGVYANGGTVRNCIIWDNESKAGDVANWGGTEAKFTYCCTLPALADEHSKSSDPMFKKGNVWAGDIMGLSPCVNAGYCSASWMGEATDYFGRPFAHGAKKNKVPIGCASPAAGGFSLIVR